MQVATLTELLIEARTGGIAHAAYTENGSDREGGDGWNPFLWIGVTSGFSANGIAMTSPTSPGRLRSQTSCIGAVFPVWYPDGRPVSFIEDDWSDDFPLVWADGWFSPAA